MTHDPSIPYQPPLATWHPPLATTQPAPWVEPPPFVDSMPEGMAARAIVAAVGAGILGQLLFVGQQAGINVAIWVALVLGAAWTFRRLGARIDRYDLWLPPSALVFATFMWLRDDAGLFLFDLPAAGSLTLAGAVALGGHRVTRRSLAGIARLGGGALAVAFCGGASISNGLRPLAKALPTNRSSPSTRVARGILIALPFILGFTMLFAAADGVFQAYLTRLFDVDLDAGQLISRGIFAFAIAWLFAGTVAAAWLSRERFSAAAKSTDAQHAGVRIGTVEAAVALIAIDALFTLFVLVQAAYLFPGNDPLAVSGLTFAQYARRGFFELVAVAVLSGTLIISLDALVEQRTRTFRVAAGALSLLTGAVLVSATVRLGLYQQAYGWTELRFYVLAAIVLLGVGVLGAIIGIAFGRVSMLPKFMAGAALAVALACNVIGPQSFVTGQNLQQAIDPSLVAPGGYADLDTLYFQSLGADSIPVIIHGLDRVVPESRADLEILLRARARELRAEAAELGWPSWNYSKQRALEALSAAGL